jgi:hypothetical protein
MDDTRPPHVAFVVNSAFIDHHGTAPSEGGRNSASNLASLPRARDQVTLHTFENSDGGKASISNLDWWSRRTPTRILPREAFAYAPVPTRFPSWGLFPSPSWHNQKSALVKPPIKAWASLRFWHSDHALGMHSARPWITLCVNHCCVETEQMFQVSGFYNDTRWTSYFKARAWPERNTAQHSHDITQPST